LTAAEKYPNITLKFNKKLVGGKVENGEVTFVEYVKFFFMKLNSSNYTISSPVL
jgi:hypothetical protein